MVAIASSLWWTMATQPIAIIKIALAFYGAAYKGAHMLFTLLFYESFS
jgi:hypothetical protein